jgi:hypothetical protein
MEQPSSTVAIVSPVFSLDRTINSREATAISEAGKSVSTQIFLEQRINAPSSVWLRIYADELIALTPMATGAEGWAIRPIPLDAKPGGLLSDWIGSPLPTPAWCFLPMNESTIRTGQFANGNDLFLPACAIAYSGSLGMISRWSTGGISSSRFLQRVRQDLSDARSLSGSMRRATLALWAEQLNAADEPILKPLSRDTDPITDGEHPLLWSGYVAIGDRPSN